MSRGTAWLDTGTFNSLMQAGQYVQVIEERQGLKIGCIEEVAYRMKYIDSRQLRKIADSINTDYGGYLRGILKEEKYRLMAQIRLVKRNMDDVMCNLPIDHYIKQLDEIYAAILFIEGR